jgi:hypothetical protein
MIKERILWAVDEETASSGYYNMVERDITIGYNGRYEGYQPIIRKTPLADITDMLIPTGKWKCEKIVKGTGRDLTITETQISLEFMQKNERTYSDFKFKKKFPFFEIREEDVVTYTKFWIPESQLIIETVETFEIQNCTGLKQ